MKPSSFLSVQHGALLVKKGGVVAFPTESFYGLAALPTSKKSIEKIFKVKERDRGKPISLILSSEKELSKWVKEISPEAQKLIKAFWPGPLTLVFKAKKKVSPVLTAGSGTIAIRVSSHPIAKNLAKKSGGAITATSCNLSGEPPCVSGLSVINKIGTRMDGVIAGGRLYSKKGSTILDTSNKELKVLREGQISRKQIQKVLKKDIL